MNYAYGLMISVVYPDEGFINGTFAAGSDDLYVRYNLGGDFRLTSGTVHIEQWSGNRFRIAFGDMSVLSFDGVDRTVAGVFDDEMTLIASDTQVPQLP